MFRASPIVDICNGNDLLRPHKQEKKVRCGSQNLPQTPNVYFSGMAAHGVHCQQQQQVRGGITTVFPFAYVLCSFLRPTSAALSRASEGEGALQHSRCDNPFIF